MRAILAVLFCALSIPAAAQTETSVEAQASQPKWGKMGIEVATPNGPRLLLGFTALGPIVDLKQIEARMSELNCPPVTFQEGGDSSKITAMFAASCERDAAVAFMGEILKNKYPSLHGIAPIILPAAETAN